MHSLDLQTVVIGGVLVNTICTMVMVALWRQNRKQFDGLSLWALDFLLQTTGLFLILLRGSIPDWASVLIANILIITGSYMGLEGLARFIGQRVPRTGNLFYLGSAILAHAYFSLINPDLTLRSLNLTVALIVICFQCARLMLRRANAQMRNFTSWVGLAFGLYTLVFAFRASWLVKHPLLSLNYLNSGSSEALFHLVLQLLFVLLTYSLGLMVNRRLITTIGMQEARFSAAFHSSPYAIVLSRMSDGAIFEVNRGFKRITGFSPDEVLGRTTVELNLWAGPKDREEVVAKLAEGRSVSGLEYTFRKKSGETFTCLFSAEILRVNGEMCVLSSVNDISERKRIEEERERLVSEREKALQTVKILTGLMPICSVCKKVRDDKGYWNQIESYIQTHSQAEFSHGICPDCRKSHYPEFEDEKQPD